MQPAESFDVLYEALLIKDKDKRLQTLQTLIESGVNVNSCRNKKCKLMVRVNIDGYTVLMAAVCEGHVDSVQVLLDAGANVNQSDEYGQTALIEAASNGDDKCVKLLIDAGANVNQSDEEGQTALIEAASNGDDKCVKLLIDAGANVDHLDRLGETALMTAACNVDGKCVRLILEAGANVNNFGKIRRTALIISAIVGSVECMELLLEAGADVNDKDARGNTALICCLICFGNSDKSKACLKLLIDAGADIDVRNINNLQPIHCALKRWQRVTFPVKYLISENCNLSDASYDAVKFCVEDYGSTLKLDQNGRLDMLKLLFACGLPRRLCQSFIVEQDTSIRNWVETVASQPYTLKSICVFKIRKTIGPGIKSKVTKLNLPNVIQNLILLKGILSMECFD